METQKKLKNYLKLYLTLKKKISKKIFFPKKKKKKKKKKEKTYFLEMLVIHFYKKLNLINIFSQFHSQFFHHNHYLYYTIIINSFKIKCISALH